MEKKAIISARDVEIQFSLRGRTLKAIRKWLKPGATVFPSVDSLTEEHL